MTVIGITGYKGRLGQELLKHGCIPLDCDITSKMSIKQALHDVNPDMVVHCAALTDVDYCEEFKDEALEINAKGTENLKVCFPYNIIYISTDYIFDGKKGRYSERDKPSDPNKLCWYGYTKLLGEQLLGNNDTIIRTTMLYGSPVKEDFVVHILQRLELNEPFEVTKALCGTPTYVPHLAEGIMEVINQHPSMPHILNIAGRDLYSRYDFALTIASIFGYKDKKYLITPTSKIGKTKRPRHAGLNTDKAMAIDVPIYSSLEGLRMMEATNRNTILKQLRMEI